jgi:hypothetical protein
MAGIIAAAATVTVFAVGLVWWLHPVLDRHEGTAAWVQAAGAILIIGATGWIAGLSSREAKEHERSAKHQLWESTAMLARNCLSAIDTLLEKHPSHPIPDQHGNFLRSYAPSDFDVPMDGLAAIPLHQIGDPALITAVLTLRGIMGRIKLHLDEVQRSPVLSQSLETVRSQRTPAFNAVASILRTVEGHTAEKEISNLASR